MMASATLGNVSPPLSVRPVNGVNGMISDPARTLSPSLTWYPPYSSSRKNVPPGVPGAVWNVPKFPVALKNAAVSPCLNSSPPSDSSPLYRLNPLRLPCRFLPSEVVVRPDLFCTSV